MLIDKTSPLWYSIRVENKPHKLNKVGATFALVILLILQIDEMRLMFLMPAYGEFNTLNHEDITKLGKAHDKSVD